ncbi:DUF5682 family protein [Actinoalloteichus hymeniacidonis]|uniref:Uncharacterized protein n=1 Tax=Actinoalloteichus hymeniacidonis TaxID=340345 RepID=A0AAC9HSH8_9PSEU|nr:DUF5682 family protein [Actinoalloteichus hymeniacidonis]AOS64161.1 hypothetical protein TL08_16805 [Actinoalloteichus hymeniacidonis]MBB5907772.1 hypothetical protein [Actinoalloteichus hymeniacidonis]
MPATFIGVRHHSPACARLVASTIESLRPAIVLVEGPSDFNDRIDELLLGHRLPMAIFSYLRDGKRAQSSWTPFCDYSPEWIALTKGREAGAEVRFIDLPAWHHSMTDQRNRYSDAENRYSEVVDELCRTFSVDNIDALWDHLFEAQADGGLAERLTAYFDLLRGQVTKDPTAEHDEESAPFAALEAGEMDMAREAYMAAWVRSAVVEAGDRPVLVITGGFHRPALVAASAATDGDCTPPVVPQPPAGAVSGSFLVPYSFTRLDSFVGYQAGMPSPEYYQQLWENGPRQAATKVMQIVAQRLRKHKQPVSTADLIAATASAEGLSRLRGHPEPTRTDMLDGLVTALVSEDLDQPLPWTVRGTLAEGAHPAVVAMVSALGGDRVGSLHPNTPAPPLVLAVETELQQHGLDGDGDVELNLVEDGDRQRSRLLHRLRVLDIPGVVRVNGPSTGADTRATESWALQALETRRTALIEAGSYGATLIDATSALLTEQVAEAGNDVDALAAVLFDAALCGLDTLADTIVSAVAEGVAGATDLGALGRVSTTVLGLWRHDTLLGSAHSLLFGEIISGAVTRVLWLAEGVQGATAPMDVPRIKAIAAVRDAFRHAEHELDLDRDAALAVMQRISLDELAPQDLRGAAFGFCWSMGDAGSSGQGGVDAARAARGAALPTTLGDWLAGLFVLARDEVLTSEEHGDAETDTSGVLSVLDEIISAMPDADFLIALPALRGAFEFFPPREREIIAAGLLARRGKHSSPRSLLRLSVDPTVLAEAMALEARVADLCAREGLGGAEA